MAEACTTLEPAITAFRTDLTDFASDLVDDPVAAAASLELVSDSLSDTLKSVTNREVYPLATAVDRATYDLYSEVYLVAVYRSELDAEAFRADQAIFQQAMADLIAVCDPGENRPGGADRGGTQQS